MSTAISADALVLLTDIDRLYSSDPKLNKTAEPITDVVDTKRLIELHNNFGKKRDWGTGGIKTKLSAARIATESGITVHLADGRDHKLLERIFNGDRGGTVFYPSSKPIGNKKSWLAYALKPLGIIFLDKGASSAIESNGASLLLVGITKIEGSFGKNEPVKIINNLGEEIGRGISSLSSDKLITSINKESSYQNSPVVIHRDALVLTKNN